MPDMKHNRDARVILTAAAKGLKGMAEAYPENVGVTERYLYHRGKA